MVDINATIPLVEPLATTVNYFMDAIKLLIGGFFGLYVITFIYRIFTFRKLSRQMKKLFNEIAEVKRRLGKLEKKKVKHKRK